MNKSRSPYKVFFSKHSGWGFTVSLNGKRRTFSGFRTDLQANAAKQLVLDLAAKDQPIPTARALKQAVPEFVIEALSEGRTVRLLMREYQQIQKALDHAKKLSDRNVIEDALRRITMADE
jgi:hypothetical protein